MSREVVIPSKLEANPQQNIELEIQTETNSSVFERKMLQTVTKYFGKMNESIEAAKSAMADIGDILNFAGNFYEKECESVVNTFSTMTAEDKSFVRFSMSQVTHRIKNALEKMSTEQKVTTILKKKKILELPTTKVFDEKEVQIGDTFETVKSEATILPIEHQIKVFLEKPRVLETILEFQNQMESSTSGKINHFVTGKVWKEIKHDYAGKEIIPIFIYNDDFGPDDGLSPHGSSNKISAYYYK